MRKWAVVFHMAIGHCYEYTHYGDDEVHVNNGNTENETPNHWDLTILMHRNPDGTGGGKVILDGEVIQEDGVFVDPNLAVLNPKFKGVLRIPIGWDNKYISEL